MADEAPEAAVPSSIQQHDGDIFVFLGDGAALQTEINIGTVNGNLIVISCTMADMELVRRQLATRYRAQEP